MEFCKSVVVPCFQQNILSELNKQRTSVDNGRFCDVVLNVSGEYFKAHLAVLACSSNFFRKLRKKSVDKLKTQNENLKTRSLPKLNETSKDGFTKTNVKENTIMLPGIKSKHISAILDFLYTGKIVLTTSNAKDIFLSSSLLQIEKLAGLCHRFLLCNQQTPKTSKQEEVQKENKILNEKSNQRIKRRTQTDVTWSSSDSPITSLNEKINKPQRIRRRPEDLQNGCKRFFQEKAESKHSKKWTNNDVTYSSINCSDAGEVNLAKGKRQYNRVQENSVPKSKALFRGTKRPIDCISELIGSQHHYHEDLAPPKVKRTSELLLKHHTCNANTKDATKEGQIDYANYLTRSSPDYTSPYAVPGLPRTFPVLFNKDLISTHPYFVHNRNDNLYFQHSPQNFGFHYPRHVVLKDLIPYTIHTNLNNNRPACDMNRNQTPGMGSHVVSFGKKQRNIQPSMFLNEITVAKPAVRPVESTKTQHLHRKKSKLLSALNDGCEMSPPFVSKTTRFSINGSEMSGEDSDDSGRPSST